jgi:hypothetical protein
VISLTPSTGEGLTKEEASMICLEKAWEIIRPIKDKMTLLNYPSLFSENLFPV